ncbi:MAG: hypothetical protein NTV46_07405 [Verrucomicrobia bacterium]|nr:hypothetical protein [Verrucomicrobiota bacterium]
MNYCACVLGRALLVMILLIGFSIATLFRQFNEIAKFTLEKPVPVEVSSIENQEVALNRLAERLELFRQQLAGNGHAVLALTPEEMNLAIAAYEPFRDLRGTLRIAAVEGDTLRLAISFPLNGKPRLARKGEQGWIASDLRYLNGMLVARPALLKHEVVLNLDAMEVSGARVPQEFINQMSPYRITARYLSDAVLGPAMAKLSQVDISAGKCVFTSVPGETTPEVISKKQVASASKRLFLILGIVASVMLAIGGSVVFRRHRAKSWH